MVNYHFVGTFGLLSRSGKAKRGLAQSPPPPTGEMVTVGVDGKEGDKPQNIQVAGEAGFNRGLGVGCGAGGIRDASPRAVVPVMMAQVGEPAGLRRGGWQGLWPAYSV